MLFTQKLKLETYEPWKEYYISYDQLKKLLKESVNTDYEWSEEDEGRFVQMLDKELDKVYGFDTKKFQEISDLLSKSEQQVNSLDLAAAGSKDLERDLDKILEDATHLDKFRRINYTGFTKLVRKHDRIHSEYRVMPLLQARLRSLPFHSEDYSPLLRRLGHIYTTLDLQSGDTSASSAVARSYMAGSADKNFHSKGYITLQFWVHPDDVMEVKTRVLRKLPVLVYNREDDDENERDPIVTSLYMDNKGFDLYKSCLEKESEAVVGGQNSIRFRWYGRLFDKPEIVLEMHNEVDGRITRINVKEKQIQKFISGDTSVVEKQAKKMRDRHSMPRAVDDYVAAAYELQNFVKQNHLEPVLRTVYKRTAFEIPGDDRVRVILDQDILFSREDSFNTELPIRDPSNWHRVDLDQPNVNIASLLRKGEHARFPYAVMEVRLRAGGESGVEKMPWVEELCNSKLIKRIPHFTKFVQGVSVLFGDNDNLDILPYWLSELDAIRDSNADQSTAQAAQTSQGQTGERAGEHAEDSDDHKNYKPLTIPARDALRDYKFVDDEDEMDSEDSGILDDIIEGDDLSQQNFIGFPTRVGKISEEESEDDEVNLPAGVEQPEQWIKNQSSPKIEAKVWLANERTFNKWLHIMLLLSAFTFTLYTSVSKASSPHVATLVSYVLFGLTIFAGLWGFYQYQVRINYIKERGAQPMDAPFGPLVVSIGLLTALIINFTAVYKNATSPHTPGFDDPEPQPTDTVPGPVPTHIKEVEGIDMSYPNIDMDIEIENENENENEYEDDNEIYDDKHERVNVAGLI